MPTTGERRKKRGYRKTAKKTKMITRNKKAHKMRCAITNQKLNGVSHGAKRAKLRKLSLTQKRPSVPFGGVLGSKARTFVLTEAIKVKMGIKKMEDVEIGIRKYVSQLKKRVE